MMSRRDDIAADIERTRAAARAAFSEKWAAERAPAERFAFTFRSDWRGCGEAMAAIAGFGAEDVRWLHDPPWHRVELTCNFTALQSMQLAVQSAPVLDLLCSRVRSPQPFAQEGGE